MFCACGAEPRQCSGHREYAGYRNGDSPDRVALYVSAGGFIRVLQQHIGDNSEGECYVPERKEPRCATRSAAEKTRRAVGTRKVKRLQECEQAAEYVAACKSEKGTLRLD